MEWLSETVRWITFNNQHDFGDDSSDDTFYDTFIFSRIFRQNNIKLQWRVCVDWAERITLEQVATVTVVVMWTHGDKHR